MTEKELNEIVAYHEAGHAVMAIHCGRIVKEICIASPWFGYVYNALRVSLPQECNSAMSSVNRCSYLVEVVNNVKVLLAGPVAECEFRRLPTRGPGTPYYTDHDTVIEILCHPSVRGLFEQYYPRGLAGLQADVEEWVVTPEIWDTIRAVSERLIDMRRMGWEEIQDLLLDIRSHKSQLWLF